MHDGLRALCDCGWGLAASSIEPNGQAFSYTLKHERYQQ